MPNNKLAVVILGPTASGKTALSIRLAEHFKTEIVSADSRQFFKEMNIGTAKPSAEQLSQVKHHFIGTRSIEDDYNAFDFEKEAISCLNEIIGKRNISFVVGGSGLYLHAISHGFDQGLPDHNKDLRTELQHKLELEGINSLKKILLEKDAEIYNQIDLNNPSRIIRAIEISTLKNKPVSQVRVKAFNPRPFNVLLIGIDIDRALLYDRINTRVDQMMVNGLEEEVRNLIPYRNKNALKTVGYQELFRYFDGEITRMEAIEKIKINSRRYAKRQLSWFKRYDDIHWFKADEIEKLIGLIENKMIQ